MKLLALTGPIQWTFILHVFVGALALATFLIPILSKKGGKLHVKTGWVYLFAMTVVCLSAFAITPWRAFLDPARTDQSQGFAFFLFFIAVFTLTAIAFGLTPLRAKNRTEPSREWIHVGPPFLLILFSLATQIVGLALGNVLLMVFPFLSLLVARKQLAYWLKAPTERRHWWYAHMEGMSTACIATVTAFLVTALPRIWSVSLTQSPALWILPGVIGGSFQKRAADRYRKQFGDA